MSRFRTRKLEDLRGHGKLLCGRLCPLEEGFHGLRGYLVADGRVRPPAVVVGLDELDHRVLGGVAGLEAPAMVHLVLRRREERLGGGTSAEGIVDRISNNAYRIKSTGDVSMREVTSKVKQSKVSIFNVQGQSELLPLGNVN